MEPTSSDDLDERLESLPWQHVSPPGGPDRRWMTVIAGAVVVIAVVASATRTLWPSPPLSAPVAAFRPVEPLPPSTPAPADDVPAPTTTSAVPLTEADLRAIAPADVARTVTAHAEWFAAEWLTIDGGESAAAAELLPVGVDAPATDGSARSFVESAVALTAEEIGPGSWEVAVLVRSLSAFEDGDYLRIPARVFLVPVGIGDEGPYVTDLPSPGPVPTARAANVGFSEEAAPDPVIDAALVIMRDAGLPEEASIGTFRLGDLWRVTGVVRDQAGVPIVVAVWLDDTGERVPAPG